MGPMDETTAPIIANSFQKATIAFRYGRETYKNGVLPLGLAWRSSQPFILGTVISALLGDALSYGMIIPVLPPLLHQQFGLDGNELQRPTSAVLGIFAGFSMICSPIAGVVADRTKSRKAPFLLGLITYIAAVTLFFTAKSITVLLVAKALQGASSSFLWAVGFAICFDTVGSGRMGTTLGTVLSVVDVGTLLAPPIGGVLYSKGGRTIFIIISLLVPTINLCMAVLMIERRVATSYTTLASMNGAYDESQNVAEPLLPSEYSDSDSTEQPVLEFESGSPDFGAEDSLPEYILPPTTNWILRRSPILMCLRNPSLVVAILVCIVQASLLGSFDATIPLEAKNLFGFSPLQSSLLFIPVGFARLVTGPLGGWAVDNYGPKFVAVAGYSFLVPVLLTFRFVEPEPRTGEVTFYCVLLALCGVGMAVVSTLSFVETGAVMERYHKSNPGLFGINGPFASLYGMNLMIFSLGMTVGSLLMGDIKVLLGYGNMMAVLASFALLSAVASYFWIGGKPTALGTFRADTFK